MHLSPARPPTRCACSSVRRRTDACPPTRTQHAVEPVMPTLLQEPFDVGARQALQGRAASPCRWPARQAAPGPCRLTAWAVGGVSSGGRRRGAQCGGRARGTLPGGAGPHLECIEAQRCVFHHDRAAHLLCRQPALLLADVVRLTLHRIVGPLSSSSSSSSSSSAPLMRPGHTAQGCCRLTCSSGRSSLTALTSKGSCWPAARMATTWRRDRRACVTGRWAGPCPRPGIPRSR